MHAFYMSPKPADCSHTLCGLLQTLEVFISLLFSFLPISVFFRDAMHSAPVSTCAPVFDHLTKRIRLHAYITMHVQARKARHATACGVHALVHRCVLCFFQPWCGTTNIYATYFHLLAIIVVLHVYVAIIGPVICWLCLRGCVHTCCTSRVAKELHF